MASIACRALLLKSNWSAYAQYGTGSIIPPSSVFDVSNGAVQTIPKPEIVHTYQTGTVWKINRLMLDGDLYYSKFQNAYTSYLDPATSEPIYVLPVGGDSITKGIELEGNFVIGYGLGLYANGTAGNAKYARQDCGWQTPRRTRWASDSLSSERPGMWASSRNILAKSITTADQHRPLRTRLL